MHPHPARCCNWILAGLALLGMLATVSPAAAQTAAADSSLSGTALTLSVASAQGPEGLDAALRIVLLMTVISLAPALLVTLTAFTRITIVLGFLRQAMGTTQAPGNQVVIGLSLFLTLVIMAPVLTQVNEEALQLLLAGEIEEGQALALAEVPLKAFMLGQTRKKHIALCL